MYFAGSSLVLLLATHALAAVPAALHQNKARQATPYAVKEPPLTTPWTDKAGTDPWPEYPRPQLERSEWKNLNGIWQYQDAQSLAALDSPPFGQPLAHEVLVPSCLESGLSGKLCQSAWCHSTYSSAHLQVSKGKILYIRGLPRSSLFPRLSKTRTFW